VRVLVIGYNYGDKRSAGAQRQLPPAWHSDRRSEMRAKSIVPLTSSQIEKFWSKVEVPYQPSCCWEWQGLFTKGGYGRYFTYSVDKIRRYLLAHRVAYTILIGDIPEDLEIDHLCRNRQCVNPDHMEPVTSLENQIRSFSVTGVNSRKTHCIHGHEFTDANTGRSKQGRRYCLTCKRRSSRKRVRVWNPITRRYQKQN
jgi:hypothetical protein